MKRILVTGGAGFLGSHLCEALLGRGNSVVCLDDLSTGREANLAACVQHRNFAFVHHDVTVPFEAGIDQIYNLACPASPLQYQRDPVRTVRTNVHGAINMLELARTRGARILQASTSEVYGDPTVHPQPESYWGNVNPIGIRSCYDEGKRCAETLFSDYGRQYGLPIKIARIFNTYGPRMQPDDQRVVSNFVVQALRGDDITLHGDGEQTRSFCYVDDMVDALVRLMATPDGFTTPVNLGNPHEITIRGLAERIVALTGSKSRIVHRPRPDDDPYRRRPDIALAKTVLDWAPSTALDDGLLRTIDCFRALQ